MAEYKSDYEKFLEEMRSKHPEWERDQRQGLALLWNRKVDFVEQKTGVPVQ